MIDVLRLSVNGVFGLVFSPIQNADPGITLFLFSAFTGSLLLFLYKKFSNQKALGRMKRLSKANMLGIKLYNSDPRIIFRLLAKSLLFNLRYATLLIMPAIALFFVFSIFFLQAFSRFEYRPFRPGETFNFKIIFKQRINPQDVSISVPVGLKEDSSPLFIERLNEVNWRLKAEKVGNYKIIIYNRKNTYEKTVRIGEGLVSLSKKRVLPSLEGSLESSTEHFLPNNSLAKEITVSYPERIITSPLLLRMDWLVFFLISSFLIAVVIKPLTRVN